MGSAASVLEADIKVEDLPEFRAEISKKISAEFLRAQKEDGHVSPEDLEKYMSDWLIQHGSKLKDEAVSFMNSKASKQGDMSVMSGQTMEDEEKTLSVLYIDKIRERNARYYLLAVDGSPASDLATDVALKLRRKIDFLHAYHSYNEVNQTTTFPNMKMEAIKTKLDVCMTSNLLPAYYQIDIRQRNEGVSSKNALVAMLETQKQGFLDDLGQDKRKPDFMVMGFSGNKKSQGVGSADGGPLLMGSTTNSVVHAVHIPIILVKKAIPEAGKRRIFVILVSPNPHSQQCLDLVLCLARPKDKLVCLYVTNSAPEQENIRNALQAQYEAELDSVGPVDSSFVALVKEGEHTAAETIIDYINFKQEEAPDFVALAPREYLNSDASSSMQFSSLTEELIKSAKSNLIICKH